MTSSSVNASFAAPLVGALFLFILGTAHSATVTVDPTAPPVPDAVYDTLENAIELNALTGDAWANGNDDTVLLVTSAPHMVVDKVEVLVFGGSANQTMTIRSAGPGPALIVADAFGPKSIKGVFELDSSGTFRFEGLTLIGGAGKNGEPLPTGYEYRSAFRLESDSPGDDVHVEIRDCVVTANDGANNPVLDYSKPFPVNNEGTFMRGIFASDDRFRGKGISCVVENCVFAYLIGKSGDKSGGTHVFRRRDPSNPDQETAKQTFQFRHCLFANCLSDGISIGGATRSYSISLEDCLVTKTGKRGVYLELSPISSDGTPIHWGGPTIHLSHSIIDSVSAPISNTPSGIGDGIQPFTGSLNFDRVTLQGNGNDAVHLAEQASSSGTITFKDVVAFGVNSLLRLQPDPVADSGPAPYLLAAQSLATNKAALTTQASSAQATLSAAVVTSSLPQYRSVNFDSTYAGIRFWDSTANPLFDIVNGDYVDKGSGDTALGGGAEYDGPGPPSSAVRGWPLYP